MKFVCYKEFDDPQEPVLPGIFRNGKTLPLARVVAVAEALAPKGLSVPDDIALVLGRLPGYAGAVRDLERARVLDKLWQEAGVTPAAVAAFSAPAALAHWEVCKAASPSPSSAVFLTAGSLAAMAFS